MTLMDKAIDALDVALASAIEERFESFTKDGMHLNVPAFKISMGHLNDSYKLARQAITEVFTD